jgi:hypothetical protein
MTFIYMQGKIYIVRGGLERCLKSWILIEGDNNENFRGIAPLYPSAPILNF